LSARVGLAAGLAVALAVVLTSSLLYLTTARTLRAQLDQDLRQIADDVVAGDMRGGPRRDPFGGAGGLVQVLDRDGNVVTTATSTTFPVSEDAVALATGVGTEPVYESITITADGGQVPLRVLTVAVRVGPQRVGAVQVAVPTTQQLATLARLRRLLVVGGIVGTGLAGLIGWALGRRATRPVAELTEVAEDVRTTGDLTRRIEVEGDDELARLATTFNEMLAALERTQRSQTQLVADASHELRTPLTSLRTNIEVLDAYERLDPDDRRDLLRDVSLQLDEFGSLVDSLVALTRDARADVPAAPVDLPTLVDEVVDGMRAFVPPGRNLEVVTADAATVMGDHDSLARAVRNLVDNAIKYGDGTIEVGVAASNGTATISVRDHGVGVAADQRDRIFDRFHRAPESRSLPGSGLGLAIVAQSATRHGGEVSVDNDVEGGAVFRLSLPSRTT
jgi:two-component system sensor histidine kinase MprB